MSTAHDPEFKSVRDHEIEDDEIMREEMKTSAVDKKGGARSRSYNQPETTRRELYVRWFQSNVDVKY